MMKNAFHFLLKALFVLEILKFLSLLFGYVEKRLNDSPMKKLLFSIQSYVYTIS